MKGTGSEGKMKGILKKPKFLSLFPGKSETDSVDIIMKQKYGHDSSILTSEDDNEERLAVIVNRPPEKEVINPYDRTSPRGVDEFFDIPMYERTMSISSKEISCIEAETDDEDSHYCYIPEIDSLSSSNVIDKIVINETYGAELREIVAGIDSTVLCHSSSAVDDVISYKEELNDNENSMISCIVESCALSEANLKEIKTSNNNASLNDLQNSVMLTSEGIDTKNITASEYLSQGKTKEAMMVYYEAIALAKSELQHIKRKMKRCKETSSSLSQQSGILEVDDAGNLINDSDFLLNSSTFTSPNTKSNRNSYLEGQYESLSLSIAHILNNLGVVQEMCEEYDKALKSCRESLKAYRGIQASSNEKDQYTPYITRTINNIAQILRAKESHAQRRKLENDAKQLLTKFHQLTTEADLEKSFLLNESLQLYKELYKLECSALGPTHPNLSKTLHSMGKLRWTLLTHEKLNVVDKNLSTNQHAAIKEILHAKKLLTAAYGPYHPNLIYIKRDLAKFYHEIEILPNALDLYQEVVELEQRYNKQDSIEFAFTLANIGDIQLRFGDVRKCIESLQDAAGIFKQNCNYSHVCKMYDTLGNLYYNEKEYSKAIACYNESLNALLKKADDILLFGNNDDDEVRKEDHNLQVASTLSNLGKVYCSMNEYKKGISCYNEALQIQIKCNTSSDNNSEMKALLVGLISDTLFNIGEAYFNDCYYKKSMNTYKTLLRFTRKSFVDSKNYNIPTAKCLERIGCIHVELKEKEEALICWNEAMRLLKELENDKDSEESKLIVDRINDNIEKVNGTNLLVSTNGEYNLLPLSTRDNVECIYGGTTNNILQNTYLTEHDKKAQVFLQQGDSKKALSCLLKALELKRQQQLNDQDNNENSMNMDIAWNLYLIGIVYQYQRENASALIFMKEAMRIYKDIFQLGDDHSLVVAVRERINSLSAREEI